MVYDHIGLLVYDVIYDLISNHTVSRYDEVVGSYLEFRIRDLMWFIGACGVELYIIGRVMAVTDCNIVFALQGNKDHLSR